MNVKVTLLPKLYYILVHTRTNICCINAKA